MPLPVGQITVFAAITVPYVLILTLVGMPFSHSWVWLYALPPGVLTWLVTRPVLEGKRLPELVLSQLRYVAEPRTWCRMMPVAERDRVIVIAQVWRAPAALREIGAVTGTESGADQQTVPARPAWPDRPAVSRSGRGRAVSAGADAVVPATTVASMPASTTPATDLTEAPAATMPAPAGDAPGAETATAPAVSPATGRARARSADGAQPVHSRHSPQDGRSVVTVRAGSAVEWPVRVVERAAGTSPGHPLAGRSDRVVVVSPGLRPGKPDHIERHQARARRPLPGPVRIVVLGSSAGAGQTVTALLTGQLLASLRSEAVAVLDLSSGPGSVTELARQIPRLLPGRPPTARIDHAGRSGAIGDHALQVVTAEHTGSGPRDADRLIDTVCARYPLTIADPSAADVPRALQAADQLVLVSPASAEAAGSLAMTLEWLDMHGHSRLVQASVAVLNGVTAQTAANAEQAAGVAVGRCRAVVRVPWDAQLSGAGALGADTVRAFTALAGVLISGLAEARPADVAQPAPAAGSAPGRVSR
jgi:TcpE family